MVDSLLSLAFSMHSSKGVFALLLGSGVSRAAGIPTGWEVVLTLIERLATLSGEEYNQDPAAWYRAKYHTEPDYARLLAELGKTPTERCQLLQPFFEPTEEE